MGNVAVEAVKRLVRKSSIALSATQTGFGPLLWAGDLERGIRLAAETGFEAIEVSVRDPADVDVHWLVLQNSRIIGADAHRQVLKLDDPVSVVGSHKPMLNADSVALDLPLLGAGAHHAAVRGHDDAAGHVDGDY